jgi:hypothetical protein
MRRRKLLGKALNLRERGIERKEAVEKASTDEGSKGRD